MFSLLIVSLLATVAAPNRSTADIFGGGDHAFEIEFVTIGDPGNPADINGKPNPAGAVNYEYRIGKYEVTRGVIEQANAASGMQITLLDMTELGGNGPDQPATGISWYEAAQFTNWLNSSSGHPVAYKFNGATFDLWQPDDPGYDANNAFRNRLAHYFLPSADEWYKSAFYDSRTGVYFHYATGSDVPPVPVASGTAPGTTVYHQTRPAPSTQAGGLSPYGTMAQGGNLWEWEETELDLVNGNRLGERGVRSGSWMTDANHVSASYRIGFPPYTENRFNSFGFRVASLPDRTLPGDFDANGVLDARDIDLLAGDRQDADYDLTQDGVVNHDDRLYWVHHLANTWLGDANLDGEFNSTDLVVIVQAGKYGRDLNAGWAEGDWTGDRRFDTADLKSVFQAGGYEQGRRESARLVPEPLSAVWLKWCIIPICHLLSSFRRGARQACHVLDPGSKR